MQGGPIRIIDAPGAVLETVSSIGADEIVSENNYLLPGLTDVHVHLREPGFSYKETIATGTAAAAAGGFTSVISMPNLDPVPDSLQNLKAQTDIINKDAVIDVHPLGSITTGEKGTELSQIEEMADKVRGFSDDGVGVKDTGLMREAMIRIRDVGSIIVAHCEDTDYPRESRDAEWRQLERDLRLAEETGCPYHMCHASTAESVELIREAKKSGIDVTAETAPHYLTLTTEDVRDDGRFKMNPPIKEKKDREALMEACINGTIDMIATDHAPHSAEEKSGGFAHSAYGITGIETAFPVLYTRLVKEGLISMDRLIEMMVHDPNSRFSIDEDQISETFTVWDLDRPYIIEPDSFKSKGRSTPFAGWTVCGRCILTVKRGKVVYRFG